MPKNNDLVPVTLPMKVRFNEKPETLFLNNLSAINVKLIDCPTMNQLRRFIVPFLEATWADDPSAADKLKVIEKDALIKDALEDRALPTALETVNLVFRIEGISLQEVTHILRYRTASFSADCSGDKWWSHKPALVPSSIQQSDDLFARYKALVRESKQLYCDMIDTKEISIMDARSILPRCLETFYFMRTSLRDALAFIKQRIDKQIQPETDNIIAYQMYCELLRHLPIMHGSIDIHQPSYFYEKMARTGKATNLYFPDADSDHFEWNENDFIYQKRRDQMNGTNKTSKSKFSAMLSCFEERIKCLECYAIDQLQADYADERRVQCHD